MNKKLIFLALILFPLLAVPCFSQEDEEEAPEESAVEQAEALQPADTVKKASAESLAYFSLMDWPGLWEKALTYQVQDSLEQFLALAESSLEKSSKLDIRRSLDAGYLRYLSQRAARNRDITAALGYSQLALRADPALTGLISGHLQLSLSRYGLSRSLNSAWRNHQTASENFWYQLGSTAGAVSFLSLFLLGSSLIFLLWLAVKGMPYLVHFLSDLWPVAVPAYSRLAVSWCLVLGLAAVLGAVSLALPVGLLAMAGVFYFGKKEKVLLVFSLLLLAASGIGLAFCRHLYDRLDDPDLEAVSRAVHSPWDESLAGKLASMQKENPADLTPAFCLALMEKRRGDLAGSAQYLNRMLEASGRNARALNNLGNIHFYLERIDSAQFYYQAAADAAPQAGIPHYNLAQIYFKLVDFKSADQERAYAMAMSGQDIKSRPASEKTELVLDELIPVSYLWGLAWKGFDPLRSFSPSESASLAFSGLWLPAWMGLSLLVLSLLLVIVFFKTMNAALCRICGRIICHGCRVTTPEQEHICPECHKLTSAATSPELREKIVANLSAGSIRRKAWLGGISNLMAPGAALLLEGLPVWAFFLAPSWGLIFAGFIWLKLSLYPYDFWQFLSWTWPGRVALTWMILGWLLGWLVYLKYINLITQAREKDEVNIHGR